MRAYICIFGSLLMMLCGGLLAQESLVIDAREIQRAQVQLDKLREHKSVADEVAKLRGELKALSDREKSLREEFENLRRELAERRRAVLRQELLGICFWREAPGAVVGPDRRAGKRGFWGLLVALYQVGLWGFGVDASLWVGVTVCVMISLAVAAPGAPGFVGTFQLGCVVAFALFGYSEELGVAYSIVLHALQVITVVICGFIILHRRGLHMADIRKDALEG